MGESQHTHMFVETARVICCSRSPKALQLPVQLFALWVWASQITVSWRLKKYLHHAISQGDGGLLDEQLHLLLLDAVHLACKGLLLV